MDDNETSPVHENLHTQIPKARRRTKVSKTKETLKPSVFIFILDSVSNSNGLRSLALTSQVLRYKYQAVNFRGLNKVGYNSRPNAWALFTGLRIEPLPAGTIHEEQVEPEVPDSCKKYVDRFPFVGNNFSAAGYYSTMIEDWSLGAFNWPNCRGFSSNRFTHNMKPYWQMLKTNGKTPPLLKNYCKSTFSVSMEYLEQFIKAYDVSTPKFAIVWLSVLAHDSVNGLYQADQSLSEFFIKYESQLENSFVFLMGDHGMRFSRIRRTKVGKFEDNNPFLTISVPKSLRDNAQLMRNLNSNSQVLVTHYDLYLTLMDIATVSPVKNFTEFSPFAWSGFMPKNRGFSVLRPIDSMGRNCKSLDIAEMFCNCKRNVTELSSADGFSNETSIIFKGAQFLTLALNDVLEELDVHNNCTELSLAEVSGAEMITENGKIFYSITYSVLPSNGTFQGKNSRDSSSASGCQLPELDPWDKTIQKYINPNYRSLKECIVVRQPVETLLSKGILRIVENDFNTTYTCKYRCLTSKTDRKFLASKWATFEKPKKTKCEIIQTRCLDDNETSPVHENLHTQIPKARRRTKVSKTNETLKPSVFIFILDSVSNSNGLRSLALTSQVLRYKYQAVNFRGLNKVGYNSRPNAWALFTGLRIEPLPADSLHEEQVEPEVPDSCKKYVDRFPFVGNNFSAAGYYSTMIEDWSLGAFNWPKCHGFSSNRFTHNMKPYWQMLKTNGKTPPLLKNYCKSTFSVSMEYLEQFIKAYDVSTPKFAIVWLSVLAHNSLNGLYQADQSLAKFFIKYESQLDNSFVFLMGDHGMRFSRIRRTKVGKFEDNNPFLTISVPKNLRDNAQLMKNLNSNSQVLVTHYDLYLTLMDIATVSPVKNFTEFSPFDWSGFMPKNRGSSVLRPIDSIGRNCKSLDIAEMFCNCKRNVTELSSADGFNDETSMIFKGAHFLTLALNDVLEELDVHNNCTELSLAEVSGAEMITENGKIFYSITYSVLPSNGTFQENHIFIVPFF
uniref:Uncharacterized protein n=1 Tax=Plectus sambesii TaxID=2011161 RepID=A0A914WQD1_9BILA